MPSRLILFLIIFVEGYVVLSAELLAIRLLIPFTGSGSDTISIIIAAVLMPLAFGYFAGGRFKTRQGGVHRGTVRRRLLTNMAIAALILTPGLSYVVLDYLFDHFFPSGNMSGRLVAATAYAAIFLVYPIYLLGQTVPLLSNYFARGHLPVMAGKILFFSTLGSFMGAVFCTLVLMTYLGVHYAAAVTIGCIAVLSLLLARRRTEPAVLLTLGCALAALILNSGPVMARYGVVSNNSHNLAQVSDFGFQRTLKLNHTMAASIDSRTGKSGFEYILYMERSFIDPTLAPMTPPKDILVVGAGGFTLGIEDDKNNYVYVDIDPALLNIAEKNLLGGTLGANKIFEAMPARAFLRSTDRKFDLILLDAYNGPAASPEHLLTKEFFQQVKDALKPGGIMAANILVSANLIDDYAIRLDNTIRYVFKNVTRQVLGAQDGWRTAPQWTNVIYSYHHRPDAPDDIYSDLKNSAAFDKPGNFK